MKAKAPIVIPPKRTYRKRIFPIAWIPSSLLSINDGEFELTFDQLVPVGDAFEKRRYVDDYVLSLAVSMRES